MTADDRTLAIYDSRVADYAKMVSAGAKTPGLGAFMQALPAGAHVLDLGCGPGDSAAVMQDAGIRVDAIDASPAMVAHARETYGLTARLARFDEIAGDDIYDGIWANFSLLHAPKAALPGLLDALHRALRPGGVFHVGLKLGEGEKRDKLGRFYAYYSEDELAGLLKQAGFTPFARQHGADAGLDGTKAPWIVIRSHG